jgi:hypothetical protein
LKYLDLVLEIGNLFAVKIFLAAHWAVFPFKRYFLMSFIADSHGSSFVPDEVSRPDSQRLSVFTRIGRDDA